MTATPVDPPDDGEDEVVGPPPWLQELRARAGELFDTDIPEPTANDAIKHDAFDAMAFREAMDNVDSLREMEAEYHKEQNYTEDFFRDIFNLMIKAEPELRTPQEMLPTHQPNQAMIEHFSKYSETQHLRQYTQGDVYGATMGIMSLDSEIQDAYERMAAAREAAAAVEQMRQDLEGQIANAQQALADDTITEAEAQAMIEQFQRGLGALQAQQAQATSTAKTAAQVSSGAIRQAAKQTAEQLEEEQQLLNAFGVDDGQLQRMDFKERYELAKRLRNNRLAKFAKLIGQFRHFAQAERRRRVKHTPDEITGIKLGDDLTRLHPGELLNLATPEMEDDFWRRYAEHALVTWELSGTEKQGRGPIVFVCDESGSMASETDVGGTREAWSKAFALALADGARRDNRDFIYIGFSSQRQQWRTDLPQGKGSIGQIIEFTEHFFGGGTYYETPLAQALAVVEDYGMRGLPRPDVVFVTDDEYGGLDEQFVGAWNKAKEKHSMVCYGIGLGINPHRSGCMLALCDNVRSIDRMQHDVTTVADIFRAI